MLKKIWDIYIKYKEGILYLIFGGLTTVVSLIAKLGANVILYQNTMYPTAMQNVILCMISWLFGVTFAYVTNRIWVFESHNQVWKEMVAFYFSRGFTLLFDVVFMQLMRILGVNIVCGTLISTVIVIILNYVLSKVWVFSKKNER